MAIDTPATIAILGAGPVGIETGLYARYLGYDVIILERDEVAANVLSWGHLRMFSPFQQLRSPLGIAALRAQDPDYRPPDLDTQLTGRQWYDSYLYPLARTDLLVDHILTGARVVGVARQNCLKTQRDTDPIRHEDDFRILVDHDDGTQTLETADVVIDTTGVFGQPNWCGTGGIPARGEQRLRSRIEYRVPDILGADRSLYEARDVLVIGSGLSAAATIVALCKVADRVPQTQVTWVTRSESTDRQPGPIPLGPFEHLPQRQKLAEAANRCADEGPKQLQHCPGTSIDAFDFDAAEERFLVRFGGEPNAQSFDRVIANVGYRGDWSICEELQVEAHKRTGGPKGVGQMLDDDQPKSSPESLVTTEPNFYVLGAKSYGRDSSYLMSVGYQQIKQLFSIIGDRADLDLYATMVAD